jgi:hypothetical protein
VITRAIERRVAGAAIGAATLFTLLVLSWRYYPREWSFPLLSWPPSDSLGPFRIYLPMAPLCVLVLLVILGCGFVRLVTGRRGATAWIAGALPLLVCVGAAAVYAPFRGMTTWRVDRIAGRLKEPLPGAVALSTSVVITFLLAALFIAVTRLRHTRPATRHVALTVGATVAGLMLQLFWFFLFIPFDVHWRESGARRDDLLIPFRPCRGAVLYQTTHYGRHTTVDDIGRIDDLWLHFLDPRRNGAGVWAVSAATWRDYFWLDRAEAAKLRVRSDDPAVIRCDSRVRPEVVSAARWHRVGTE